MRRPPPTYDDRRTLDVRGITRTFWVAPDPAAPEDDVGSGSGQGPRPLLIGLHGLGSSGSRMSRWTALGHHGPRAGFLSVFPDALDTIWDDHGCGRRDGADDIAFIAALIEHLTASGAADPERVVLAGVSTGACFAERLVRTGATQVSGMALVTGTARVASTTATPISASTPVVMMAGTEDPMTPYEGGAPRGAMGRHALRHVRRMLVDPSGHESVAPEGLAAEWAAANGCTPTPEIDFVRRGPGTIPVHRLTWTPENRDGRSVVLYRIDGGGHGWPGGKQYLPARLIGRIPQHLDATAIVLDFARASARLTAAR